MYDFLTGSDSEILNFPVEEYINTYKKEPEGFEILNAAASALGCFCFCLIVSEIFENIPVKPSFREPEGNFTYVLSNFEKKYIKTLSQAKKNKLFSAKEYVINFEKSKIISGKAFINFHSSDEESIKLSIKLDLKENFINFKDNTEVLNTSAVEKMTLLFDLICSELYLQINKLKKNYTQKTVNYIPDYLKFATAPFIQELRRLMTSQKDKISVETGDILAEKLTKTGNYVFKHTYDDDINSQIVSRIMKMNDLTVDVLNGFIHIWTEKAKTPDFEVLLCIDDLLFIRGKKAGKNQKGSRGGYKDSQRQEITEHLNLLSNLTIEVSNAFIAKVDSKGKRSYESYSGQSPIIYVKKSENSENNEHYFYVKPGEVLALTLKGVGTKTGLIHKKVAEYDYYRNFWEKRIGNYLAWLWRNRQNKADFLKPVTVETLLNQIGEENKFKRPQSVRSRLEDALYKLEDDNVIKNWQYQFIDESVLTGRNWFETWLNLKLIIEPPVEILEEYSKIRKIKTKSPAKFDFQEIITIIKEKNLGLIQIAEEINVKQEVLSGIISGKIQPDASEKRKIQNWLIKQKG